MQRALEVFERRHAKHLDARTLDRVCRALLALYPQTPVIALRLDNTVVEVPESIPLQGNVALEGRSGLDLVAFDGAVIAAWDQVLAEGVARCEYRPAAHPELTGLMYLLDLRERHGVILAVCLGADGGDVAVRPEVREAAPRFTTVRKDARSLIVTIDEATTQILGWSPDEMEGHRSLEFMHEDDQALAIDNWMEMIACPGPGRRVRLRHRHRDGSWVWFEVTNHNLLDDPLHNCVVSEMVDISDEMAAHEELRANQQLLHRMAGAIPIGLLQIDTDRRVVYTNDRLHQILGIERQETAAAQLAAVIESDRPLLEHAFDEVLSEGREVDIEVQLCPGASAGMRFCTVSVRALSLENGTVTGAIACMADVTESARMREELRERATFDELTGCYNRASIVLALERIANGAERPAECAVVYVDVDCFKAVNDTYGHAAGDELLRVVAQRLRGVVREHDMVGRMGGDEFLVVCPDIGGSDQALKLAERLASAVRRAHVRIATERIPAQISVGVAWSAGAALDATAMVTLADGAMYESKREKQGQPKLAYAA